MQKLILLILISVLPHFSFAQHSTDSNALIVFDTMTYDFGGVVRGAFVSHAYHFINKGTDTLVITDVFGSSNADFAEYPKEPIPPGKGGVIRYNYTTTNCHGVMAKTCTVQSNSMNGPVVLHFNGYVKEIPFKFDTSYFDFDTVLQGTIVTHEYKFTNISKEPIIITEAHSSCHCIVWDYPKEPILPGKTGVVSVSFNSAGKMGNQDKTVTVTFRDCPEPAILHIEGVVKTNPGFK